MNAPVTETLGKLGLGDPNISQNPDTDQKAPTELRLRSADNEHGTVGGLRHMRDAG